MFVMFCFTNIINFIIFSYYSSAITFEGGLRLPSRQWQAPGNRINPWVYPWGGPSRRTAVRLDDGMIPFAYG